MLTPLDALGVAAAVVQFIDFTSSFISSAREIHKSGSTVEAKLLREKTSRLIAWNSGLRHRRGAVTHDASAESRLEKELDDVLARCCETADRLILLLGKLSASNKGLVNSIRTTFLTILNKDVLQRLDVQLKAYREEITGCILAILNEKLERQYDDFTATMERLEGKHEASNKAYEKILEILTFSRPFEVVKHLNDEPRITEFEYSVLASQDLNSGGWERDQAKSSYIDERLVSAVLFIQDEQGNKVPVYLSPTLHGHRHPSPESSHHLHSIRTTSMFQDVSEVSEKQELYTGRFQTIVRSVINAVMYSKMRQREFAIVDAYKSTFQWIFQKRAIGDASKITSEVSPQIKLVEFLESGGGFFWVSGKPGSGKSTLMKFICDHELTQEALKKWADPYSLVTVSHFLWYAGGNLHSSQEGLLRSLLLGILSTHSELVPIAFPNACRDLVHKIQVGENMWALPKLSSALHRVLSHEQRRFRLCLFLDGADEILGSSEGLCEFLQELIKYPGVKAVISSRPWNIFSLQFRDSPSIRVQDLTQGDIRSYAQGKLTQDMFTLNPDANQLQDLVERITDRSNGVFLWVYLVVNSLREGLRDGDLPWELSRRLEQMPSELEDFYKSIFDSMQPYYREEAARMFYIMIRASEMELLPLSVLQMNFALDETLETATNAQQTLMLSEEREAITRKTARKLQSRTRGLIEAIGVAVDAFSGSSAIEARVDFLHKTALDFLYSPETQTNLSTYGLAFDPNAALLASCLREIKVSPREDAIILSSDSVWKNLGNCLLMASCLEFKWKRPYTVVLDELNKILSKHWSAAQTCKSESYQQEWLPTSDFESWSAFYLEYKFKEGLEDSQFSSACLRKDMDHFLILATLSGCVLYVVNKTLAVTYSKSMRTELLAEMIAQYFTPYVEHAKGDLHLRHFNLMTAVKQLLLQGADPNASFALRFKKPMSDTFFGRRAGLTSIWEYYLMQITYLCCKDEGQSLSVFREMERIQAVNLFRICTSFLAASADPTLMIDPSGLPDPVYALQISTSLLSVEKVLQRLRATSLDPSSAVFVGKKHTQQLESVYQEAMSAYRLQISISLENSRRKPLGLRTILDRLYDRLFRLSAFAGFAVLVLVTGWFIHIISTKRRIDTTD